MKELILTEESGERRNRVFGGRLGLLAGAIYLSTVLAACLLVGTGLIPEFGRWYSSHLALREQTNSLIAGRLGLSDSVSKVRHDELWDNNRVQQVWGLGGPAWRVPFEASSSLFGLCFGRRDEEKAVSMFPDRIAFGVALVIVIFIVLLAFTSHPGCRDLGSWIRGMLNRSDTCAAVILLALFSPFLMLLHSPRFSVYEEVQAYSYLGGIGLLAGTVLFVEKPRFWLFLAMAALSGLVAFVRPTAGVFGVVALTVLLVRSRGLEWQWWRLGVGVGVFGAGVIMLLITNWIRFGSGFEFGHNLNLNDIHTMRFAGRFGSSYESEPILSAARELKSLLFFGGGYLSETLRWRQTNFPTYNVSYLIPLVVVALWSVNRCRVMFRRRTLLLGKTEILAFWFLTCTVALFLFYLRFPLLNSRYLLDFAPGFAAGMLAFVYVLRDWGVPRFGERFRWILLAAVVMWWGCELVLVRDFGREPFRYSPVTRTELLSRMERPAEIFREMPAYYETGMPFQEYVASANGSGWNWESGNTRAAIALFVEDPEFLELTVAPVAGMELSWDDYRIIRAKIGLEFLEMESMTPTEEGMMLRFAGPKRTRYQSGIQVMFVSFMTAEELHDGWSRFRLLKVKWRE